MPRPLDRNRIDQLKKRLDSRGGPEMVAPDVVVDLRKTDQVVSDWGHGDEVEPLPSLFPKRHMSLPKKILTGSAVFFCLAAVIALAVSFGSSNNISSDNISITVTGPVSVDGGQELALDVEIKNQNSIDLELADLRVTYPSGTRNPDNVAKEQRRVTESLGDIPSGESVTRRIRSVLYGEANTKKEIVLNVEYRVKGSNAIFEKEKKFEIALSSAPVNLIVSSLKEINSNQDIEFVVDITSNSPQVIRNLLLKADYGFGFTFASASPQPSFGQNIWYVGDVRPGEKRTITVRGKIEGQDGEERAFRFSAGIQGIADKKSLEPEFLSVSQNVLIQKPFIGLGLTFDGDSAPIYAATPSRNIRTNLIWTNNLPTKIRNAKITAKIYGSILNKNSVSVDAGFYNSASNSIIWDATTNSTLKELAPGDSGQVSFSFASIAPEIASFGAFKNAEIIIEVSVQGNRDEDSQVPEELVAGLVRKVRVSSEAAFSPKVLRVGSAFANTGPIPPQAETETTYTVVWTLTNTINDLRDVKVSAVLPPYVRWPDVTSPASEQVDFDPETREVTWNVEELKASTGFSTSPRQVSFQVALLPSVSQIGFAPVLVGDATVTGVDRYTAAKLRYSKTALTTRFNSDPSYRSGDETVVR